MTARPFINADVEVDTTNGVFWLNVWLYFDDGPCRAAVFGATRFVDVTGSMHVDIQMLASVIAPQLGLKTADDVREATNLDTLLRWNGIGLARCIARDFLRMGRVQRFGDNHV